MIAELQMRQAIDGKEALPGRQPSAFTAFVSYVCFEIRKVCSELFDDVIESS